MADKNNDDILVQAALITSLIGPPDREEDIGWVTRWGWGSPPRGFWARFTVCYMVNEKEWCICSPVPWRPVPFDKLIRRLQNPLFRLRHRLWRYRSHGVNSELK